MLISHQSIVNNLPKNSINSIKCFGNSLISKKKKLKKKSKITYIEELSKNIMDASLDKTIVENNILAILFCDEAVKLSRNMHLKQDFQLQRLWKILEELDSKGVSGIEYKISAFLKDDLYKSIVNNHKNTVGYWKKLFNRWQTMNAFPEYTHHGNIDRIIDQRMMTDLPVKQDIECITLD